jgi:hypothetical protein
LLYTNYLPLNIQEAKLFLFAGDTMLVTQKSENVLKHEVYNVMGELKSWFHKSILMLNAEKQGQCHSLLDKVEIC